jgi:hypothetical protein
MHLHIEYLNILCRPLLSDADLLESMDLMKKHNQLFVAIYCNNDASKTFISIFIIFFVYSVCLYMIICFDILKYLHLRKHWPFWIKKYGAPAFYSTMHWESKHKQLKQIKERKTNNTNHSRDIAQKDVAKTVYWLRNEPRRQKLVSI